MYPQLKPNRWSCLVTAFAIRLDMGVRELIRVIGHDGSEIVCPELAEPLNRRGFHEQECIEVAVSMGFACTPIELFPAIQYANQTTRPILFPKTSPHWDGNRDRFLTHLNLSRGVVVANTRGRAGHAMAYELGRVISPDTGDEYQFTFENFEARGLFAVKLWRIDRIA